MPRFDLVKTTRGRDGFLSFINSVELLPSFSEYRAGGDGLFNGLLLLKFFEPSALHVKIRPALNPIEGEGG